MSRSKRVFDVIASVSGLVLLSPILAIIAVAITAGDRGPVLFSQQRVGRDGRTFRLLKFRTMIADAERIGPALTIGTDPRITPIGRLLRRAKLDELPQLINVARGEMSLVGPRPEVPKFVAMYTPAQRRVLALRPGITDPASTEYVREAELLAHADDPERAYIEEVMPRKLQLNLAYAETATLWSDIATILRTMGVVVRARGGV
jgi:lipopolysaccharide/colanic/teichoic acid biosynthesis glycosyltransferase